MSDTQIPQLLTAKTNTWLEIEGEEPALELTKRLRIADQSDNLAFFFGLGTSLCLNTEPTINRAPTMAILWAEIVDTHDSDKAVREKVMYESRGVDQEEQEGPEEQADEKKDFELLLTHCQLYLQLHPGDATIKTFIAKAEELIAKLCNFPDSDDELLIHETFVRKICSRSPERARVRVFTTNYDRCFEEAANRVGALYIDGFSFDSKSRFDASHFDLDVVRRRSQDARTEFLPKVFHLLKLHGSVDWYRSGSTILKRESDKPLLIYPKSTKYQNSYEQPFFEMMSRLHITLRQSNTTLVVCGFGFRDQHLVEPILHSLRTNPGLQLLVVDPFLKGRAESDDPQDALSNLRRLILNGDNRITLLNASFEQFVKAWPIAEMETARDQHEERYSRRT